MRRWGDVILLGVVGSLVCVVFCPILQKVSEGAVWLLEYLWRQTEGAFGEGHWVFGKWPLAYMVWCSFLVLAISLALALLIQLGALRWGHTKSLLLYPPTWVAALWPVAILGGCFLHVGMVTPQTAWECVKLLFLSSMAVAIVSLISGRVTLRLPWKRVSGNERQLQTTEETLTGFADDPDRLIEWLMLDEPVKHPEKDLFESHVFARRIAELITDQQLGSIGLIGPRGSGKTTILNLVDFMLHKSESFKKRYRERWCESSVEQPWRKRWFPPRILTCRVQAWGFAKEPAATVVLSEAVAELSGHVDCLSVRSLPEEYLAAIRGVAPVWIHAPLAIASAHNPSAQLKRLEPLLEAINARLVVFIEDLDRNVEMPDVAFAQSIKNEGNNIKSEVLNDLSAKPNGHVFLEVESLLDRMGKAERVSFVLAISRSSA